MSNEELWSDFIKRHLIELPEPEEGEYLLVQNV
jgi:hypothetical protein